MKSYSLFFFALACVACTTPGILKAPTGPHTDYPCGVTGVSCRPQSATCCGQGDVCGGTFPNVGCPAGQCCYEGTDSGDFRRVRQYPQTPEQS